PTKLQLAATADDATAGKAITLTSPGTGTAQQFTPVNVPPITTDSTAAVVKAGGDVLIRADSEENIVSVSVAGAGAGIVGVAGSIGVWVVNVGTTAYIGSGATVHAGGNVLVSANDKDGINMLAGAITVAGVAAIGASLEIPIV